MGFSKVSAPAAIVKCTVDCHLNLLKLEDRSAINFNDKYEQCEIDCTKSYSPDQDDYMIDTFQQRAIKLTIYCVFVILLIGVYYLCKNYD